MVLCTGHVVGISFSGSRTADFWLIIGANTKYSRFNFSFSDLNFGIITVSGVR